MEIALTPTVKLTQLKLTQVKDQAKETVSLSSWVTSEEPPSNWERSKETRKQRKKKQIYELFKKEIFVGCLGSSVG